MSLERSLLIPLATLSVAAAGIHFAVVGEHFEEFPLFGFLFLGLAWFQAIWPVPYAMRRSALVGWIGVVVNLGAVAVWLWSRTSGLPFGPEPGQPEVAGPLDLTASAYEVVLASLLVVLLVPRTRSVIERLQLAPRTGWLGAALWSGLIVAIASVALLAPDPVMVMR